MVAKSVIIPGVTAADPAVIDSIDTTVPQVVIMTPSSATPATTTAKTPTTGDDGFFKMIQTVVLLYLCFGVVCYFINRDWFDTLYRKPWDAVVGMFTRNKPQMMGK